MVTHAKEGGYNGIIFSGTGLGHLPIDNPLGDANENTLLANEIRSYVSAGGVAIMTTQCMNGSVNMDVYSKGRDLQEIGMLGHQTTNTLETATVKLFWLLSNTPDEENQIDWINTTWSQNLVGENLLSLKD